MLMIRDLPDLKLYLETRRQMFNNAKRTSPQPSWESGAVYALDEAIKAVDAVIAGDAAGGQATTTAPTPTPPVEVP